MTYEIYVSTDTLSPYGKPMFDCDCGRSLVAGFTECDRCGAHYKLTENGYIEQVAPPIGDG